jgi:two-component system response regulator MprA
MEKREGKPILVVDDDRSILETMSDLLRGEGYAVVTAADGLEALAEMTRSPVAFILLDMRMPRMDGWQFTNAVRERGWRVPIIVMTAASDARRWAQEIHADAYIAKPFDVERLLDMVKRFWERSRTN